MENTSRGGYDHHYYCDRYHGLFIKTLLRSQVIDPKRQKEILAIISPSYGSTSESSSSYADDDRKYLISEGSSKKRYDSSGTIKWISTKKSLKDGKILQFKDRLDLHIRI
jgi:hypothetical protein